MAETNPNEQSGQIDGVKAIDTTPVLNTLDLNSAAGLLDGEVKAAPVVETTPTTQVERAGILDKANEPAAQSPVVPPVTPPVTQTTQATPEGELEYFIQRVGDDGQPIDIKVDKVVYEEVESLKQAITSFENQVEAVEEFKRDPNSFLAKYASNIIINQFDKVGYVRDKLAKDFGAEFTFDQSDAFKIGTASYNYLRAQDKYANEADNYVETAQNALQEEQNKAKQVYEDACKLVMTKRGVDETTFNKEVRSVLENSTQEQILDLITEAILIKKNGASYKANLETTAKVTQQTTPAAVIAGAGQVIPDANTDKAKMGNVFGQGLINNAYERLPAL